MLDSKCFLCIVHKARNFKEWWMYKSIIGFSSNSLSFWKSGFFQQLLMYYISKPVFLICIGSTLSFELYLHIEFDLLCIINFYFHGYWIHNCYLIYKIYLKVKFKAYISNSQKEHASILKIEFYNISSIKQITNKVPGPF